MTPHDEILERMSGANPLPDVDMITDGQLAEMTLQVEEARRADEAEAQPQELAPVRPRARWLRPAVAFAAALLAAFAVIGAVSLTTGGESNVADQPSSTTSSETTATSTTTTADRTPEGWNPVLATTLAGPAPEPAACSADTDPTTPGPPDQNRPMPRDDDHDGAFDRHLGKVIYVDIARQTWTFDVCTNTWEQIDATGEAIDTSLVYDVDSDVTIALGPGDFSVYDAATNEWTRPYLDVVGGSRPDGFWGVAYDPVSGLVITTSESGIWAFDVEAASLTRIGSVPGEAQLAGYLPGLDRLLFAGVDTVLVDPRNGDTTTAAGPPPLRAPGYDFFEAGGTVFLSTWIDDVLGVCGFDAEALTWSRCYDPSPPDIGAFSSKVDDPINNRVILTQSTPTTHDVWALDLDAGSTSEIVAGGVVPTFNGRWDPVLATTRAGSAPEPARCPDGTNPDDPGPIEQQRPTTTDDDHDGAFDQHTGRVMYVDTMQRTWAFDVCTNTWHNLEPEGIPIDESLVYDIDSDVTIALGEGVFAVYDARTNEWTRPPFEVVGGPGPSSFLGVAYDPVSGLVIAAGDNRIWAYDVEDDRLTNLGGASVAGYTHLAGYVPSIDRLVLVADLATVLVDPRTGEMTMPTTGEVPFAGWGWYDFFDAAGTVFIGANDAAGCGFNPETLAWDLCFQELSPPIHGFASRVEDPIHGRLVLIHRGSWDDVWALDLAKGEMTELLGPSQ